MLRVTLAVDGSESSRRATRKLIGALDWYKERPRIDLVAVQQPIPRFPNMSLVIADEAIERFYADESERMLAPSKKLFDAAKVQYTAHKLVGSIPESIVAHAKKSKSDMIYMGTRGMTALSNIVLGSVATKVLHLAHIPVVLVH